jgi:hypothetical protein
MTLGDNTLDTTLWDGEYVNPLKTNVHDIHYPEIMQNLNDPALYAAWML